MENQVIKNENTKRSQLGHSLLLLLTAIIWGTSFVAQSAGMQHVGPLIYNCIRNLLGALILLPVILIRDKVIRKGKYNPNSSEITKLSVKKGIIAGIILCIAGNLQNVAMVDTPAGKAGFMTAFYIILVPILGIFIGRKTSFLTWISVMIALAGLYFLCIGRNGSLILVPSDIVLLGCALFFAFHILYVDHVAASIDGLALSCTQFTVAGILGIPFIYLIDILIFNMVPSYATLSEAWIPIMYSGFLSCGAGYTLQVIGQKGVNPTLASLIMSLESVVSAISGLIILRQKLSADETIGCIIMFAAIILAQLPAPKSKKFK